MTNEISTIRENVTIMLQLLDEQLRCSTCLVKLTDEDKSNTMIIRLVFSLLHRTST